MALALGEEVVTADEQAVVADFIAFLKEASLARAGSTGPVRRFNQTRATGCVRASSRCPTGCPPTCAWGCSRRRAPSGAHPVRQRHLRRSDTEQDIRGMSIKVTGVPGVNLMPGSTEQDFVLFSHPVMLAGTAPDFLELLKANEARRAEADDLLRHASAGGRHRRRRRGAPHLPPGHPVLQRDAVPLRRRQGGEVRA